jgi:hypothetical protein
MYIPSAGTLDMLVFKRYFSFGIFLLRYHSRVRICMDIWFWILSSSLFTLVYSLKIASEGVGSMGALAVLSEG